MTVLLNKANKVTPTEIKLTLATGFKVREGFKCTYTKNDMGLITVNFGIQTSAGTDTIQGSTSVLATLPVGYRPKGNSAVAAAFGHTIDQGKCALVAAIVDKYGDIRIHTYQNVVGVTFASISFLV